MRRIVCAAALAAAASLASASPERTPLSEPLRQLAFPCAGSPTGLVTFGPVLWQEELDAINAMLAREIPPVEFVQRMIALDLGSAGVWRWLLTVAHVCPGTQA